MNPGLYSPGFVLVYCPKTGVAWTLVGGLLLFCPKLGQVRALARRFLLLLSEVVAGSDSGTGFSPITVRSRGGFGLWRGDHSFSVRSRGRFGLWHMDFPFFCPKSWQARTLVHGFLLLLSEVVAGSDSGTWIFPFSVRSSDRFGIWSGDFSFFCPKSWQVRTL